MLDGNSFSYTKNNDFLSSPEAFCHAVRVLMRGYALVSTTDPPGEEWSGLEPALRRVSAVGNMSRSNSKSAGNTNGRIMEVESAVRMEWAKLGQVQPGVSLGVIIDVVSQRHSIWPLVSEFTRNTPTRKGAGKYTWQGGKGDAKGESIVASNIFLSVFLPFCLE